MTQLVADLVISNSWMEEGAVDFLNIMRDTPVHRVFEMISLNVATSFNSNWKEIYKSTIADPTLYSAKIITNLLIISCLRTKIRILEKDIRVLVGLDNIQVVDDFFSYLQRENR